MPFQFPADVIQQVQIALRNEAGLSFYDRLESALRSETTTTSVASYDHSPPGLRCKHCKGRLLNGLQSLICVFCGKYLNGDVPHDPISFESTSSYRFLLRSLGLKGSEMIGVAVKEREFYRPPTPRKRIPLSKLLNLQLEWPDRSSETETTTINNTQRTTSSMIHTELDLGKYLPRLKKEETHISNDERRVKGNRIEGIESKPVSSVVDNLTQYHNIQPSETVVRSSNGAHFQFSDQNGGKESQLDSKPKGDFDEWAAFTSSTSAQDRKEFSNDWKESSCTSEINNSRGCDIQELLRYRI